MRWSARFHCFSLWISFSADLRRFFSCFIFVFWIVSFFFGLDMLVVFFRGLWVALVTLVGGGAGKRGQVHFICARSSVCWDEIKGGILLESSVVVAGLVCLCPVWLHFPSFQYDPSLLSLQQTRSRCNKRRDTVL